MSLMVSYKKRDRIPNKSFKYRVCTSIEGCFLRLYLWFPAANGVILITTKQGKEGKPTVDVKVNVGVQLPTNLPEMLNSQQYGEVLWNAMRNAGLTPQHDQYGNGATPVIPDYILPAGAMEGQVDLSTYNTAENQFMRANKIGTNWADEVYRPHRLQTLISAHKEVAMGLNIS